MFKKIPLALLISCISASSYAYFIKSNFQIENNTNIPMKVVMDQPNGQPTLEISVYPHDTTNVLIENGDHGGALYQASEAPFKIMSADKSKQYGQGRVAYQVWYSM